MSTEPTRVRLSVLDRLLDESPRQPEAHPGTWGGTREAFRDAFMRDLEWLLNTRRVPEPVPELYPEANRSVYYYGLPDVTSLSADAPEARERLAREIEECIRVFEPRLITARVLVAPADDSRERRVRFVIDGVLRMDPHTERILLDTVLETPTGKFLVAGDAHA